MDVLFAVLPFADINRPAIGVSLLKAAIARRGFSSRVEYFNLDLAERLGYDLYHSIANSLAPESLVGEWFFADVVFEEGLPHGSDYASRVLVRHVASGDAAATIVAARRHRHDFVELCAQQIQRHGPRIVGFTTTFHQTCACLAVARRLKALPDPPVIVFGGANCEGEMGRQLLQSFTWIDYVCLGEGDVAFPALVERLLHDGYREPPPGIVGRGSPVDGGPPETIRDLDSLPIPDYDEYFERVKASPLRSDLKIDLLIETARGCWWGAKQHCTFCGLNGSTMAFRSKSAGRTFAELGELSRRYGVKRVASVDNILDMKYLTTVFPRLRDSDLDLELFYEVKANLRYEQLELLRAGGMRSIQPGIESFSDEALRLMRKGCTALQNIQLLRWCEELGIEVAWNILVGFPGESPDEYQRMAELIPLLTHLPPPAGCSPVRLDRFSPFFVQPAAFGLKRVRPASAYFYVYPLGRKDLTRLAYFFDFDYADGRLPHEYARGVRYEVQRWWEVWSPDPARRVHLDAVPSDGDLVITDTRPVATARLHHLTGLMAQVYLICDSAQTVSSLSRHLGNTVAEDVIRRALGHCVEAKLMVERGSHYLSLAVLKKSATLTKREATHVFPSIQEAEAAQPLLRLV